MADEPLKRRGIIPSELYRQTRGHADRFVDLVVIDIGGRLLLLQRRDEPAKGHGGFPAGGYTSAKPGRKRLRAS
jgi:8-oxo-dGTP pyrophosphatase MutT (NUDIX family)